MPPKRRLTIAAVNVTMHPHSPALYRSLFMEIHEALYMTKIRGADWGMIGTLQDVKSGEIDAGMVGSFWRFLNLDPNEPWLDLQTRKAISPEDEKEPILPDHLKPHLRRSAFALFPNGHRVFFNAREISPGLVTKLLTGLFAEPKIAKKYGDVSVIVECEESAIEKINDLARRATIDIHIRRPNGDDLTDEKDRVMNRLVDQNAAALDQKLTAPRGGDLQPDKDTKVLMSVALSNGRVHAVGYDQDDARVEIDTRSHPLKKDAVFDPEEESALDILLDTAKRLLQRLRRRG